MTTRKLHDAAMAAKRFHDAVMAELDGRDLPNEVSPGERLLALKQALAALEQD